MKGALDSLGVKPRERRAVILMLMGFFLVGNVIWLVFEIPSLIQTQTKLGKYEQENKKELNPPKGKRGLKEKLKDKRTEVESQKGSTKKIKDGEQAADLIDLVERQALISGLNLGTSRGGQGSRLRDQDFEEFKRTIKFTGNLSGPDDIPKNNVRGEINDPRERHDHPTHPRQKAAGGGPDLRRELSR